MAIFIVAALIIYHSMLFSPPKDASNIRAVFGTFRHV